LTPEPVIVVRTENEKMLAARQRMEDKIDRMMAGSFISKLFGGILSRKFF
jgi:hypothetical protein